MRHVDARMAGWSGRAWLCVVFANDNQKNLNDKLSRKINCYFKANSELFGIQDREKKKRNGMGTHMIHV